MCMLYGHEASVICDPAHLNKTAIGGTGETDFWQLKHVNAWVKPCLHKISKTVINLPGFGIICAELAA